jgi:hypothetical protein
MTCPAQARAARVTTKPTCRDPGRGIRTASETIWPVKDRPEEIESLA